MLEIKQRTFTYAVRVAKLINDMPYNLVNKIYFGQLVRCSSSIGANYRAARRAKSDADFMHKLKITEEEADETIYFLELLREFNHNFSDRITELINEGTEILKIIVSSINTTRARLSNK